MMLIHIIWAKTGVYMNLAVRGWDRLANWLVPKQAHLNHAPARHNESAQCEKCVQTIDQNEGGGCIVAPLLGQADSVQYHLQCLPKDYDYSTLTLLQDSARPLTNIILNLALFGALTAAAFCLKTDPRIIKVATVALWGRYAYLVYTNLRELAFQKNRVVRLTPNPTLANKDLIKNAVKITLLLAASVALAGFAIYNFNRMPNIPLTRKWSIPLSIIGSVIYYRLAQKTFSASFLPDKSLRHRLPGNAQ
jgi:hypothetical protein